MQIMMNTTSLSPLRNPSPPPPRGASAEASAPSDPRRDPAAPDTRTPAPQPRAEDNDDDDEYEDDPDNPGQKRKKQKSQEDEDDEEDEEKNGDDRSQARAPQGASSSRAYQAGVGDERARFKTILESPMARTRPTAALKYALAGFTADQARAMLEFAATEAPPRERLADRMEGVRQPEIGSDAPRQDNLAVQIIEAGKRRRGEIA
jgi:hypothetical protein